VVNSLYVLKRGKSRPFSAVMVGITLKTLKLSAGQRAFDEGLPDRKPPGPSGYPEGFSGMWFPPPSRGIPLLGLQFILVGSNKRYVRLQVGMFP